MASALWSLSQCHTSALMQVRRSLYYVVDIGHIPCHKCQIKNLPIFNVTRFQTESPKFLHFTNISTIVWGLHQSANVYMYCMSKRLLDSVPAVAGCDASDV